MNFQDDASTPRYPITTSIAAADLLFDNAVNARLLFDERAGHWQGLSKARSDRLRGYLLTKYVGSIELKQAIPYILEELSIGDSSFCAAAASRALNPEIASSLSVQNGLLASIQRYLFRDEKICLDSPDPMVLPNTTVLLEHFHAVARLASVWCADHDDLVGMASSRQKILSDELQVLLNSAIRVILQSKQQRNEFGCCGGKDQALASPVSEVENQSVGNLSNLVLEDQYGSKKLFTDWFGSHFNVIAFFYTRCMNPEKCSATIEKLARLAQSLRHSSDAVSITAITYDPEFDTRNRIAKYGRDRGAGDGSKLRLLRSTDNHDQLKSAFNLNVTTGDATITRHSIELFVADADHKIRLTVQRKNWQEIDIENALLLLLAASEMDQ